MQVESKEQKVENQKFKTISDFLLVSPCEKETNQRVKIGLLKTSRVGLGRNYKLQCKDINVQRVKNFNFRVLSAK